MPSPFGVPAVLHGLPRFVSGLRRRFGAPPLALGLVVLLASPLHGQSAEVSQEENFRNEPNGGLIGVLAPGTPLIFHQQRENWIEVTLEGWVWTRSLLTTERSDYDLILNAAEGENIRDRPSGEILGRIENDTYFEEVERIPGWTRVRRRGWIWAASVTVDEDAAAPSTSVSPVPVTEPPPSASTAAPPAPAEVVAGGRPVLNAPDGDTLSVLAPGAEVAVLSREGNWARVRVEGWVWAPEGEDPSAPIEDPGNLTLASVTSNPGMARGRIVTWQLQYISSEVAESVRTDFYEGEPYLLMRPAEDEGGAFIYVALPPELVSEVSGLVPLERVTVVARVRTGASRLTGSPILDLIELRSR